MNTKGDGHQPIVHEAFLAAINEAREEGELLDRLLEQGDGASEEARGFQAGLEVIRTGICESLVFAENNGLSDPQSLVDGAIAELPDLLSYSEGQYSDISGQLRYFTSHATPNARNTPSPEGIYVSRLSTDFFSTLDRISKNWGQTYIPELIQASMQIDTDDPSQDVAFLYQLADHALFNKQFTFDDTETKIIGDKSDLRGSGADAIYGICFFDRPTRHMVGNIIKVNQLFQRIEAQLVDLDDDERELVDDIKLIARAEVFGDNEWRELLSDQKVPERIRLSALSTFIDAKAVGKKLALSEVFDDDNRPNVKNRVIATYRQAAEDIYRGELVVMMQDDNPFGGRLAGKIQDTDIGHQVEGMRLRSIEYAWLVNPTAIEDKNGRMVILEDSQEQAHLYKRWADSATSYEPDHKLTPEGVDTGMIHDDANRVFLLDVQNGDDLTAGTDLAFRLVDALEAGTARTEPVEIIIWSYSGDAVEDASRRLSERYMLNKEDSNFQIMTRNDGDSNGMRIELPGNIRYQRQTEDGPDIIVKVMQKGSLPRIS
ncbi:hypothetical protein KBC31_00965 [Candidatus Saccharibacteria bacterium]|nr:hypothetical protein [Candidatus Saccharibacteria bacterium]